MAKTKSGRVLNPRNIPAGTPVISQVLSSVIADEELNGVTRAVQTTRTVAYFEGDVLVEADSSDWKGFVERGFIEVIEE